MKDIKHKIIGVVIFTKGKAVMVRQSDLKTQKAKACPVKDQCVGVATYLVAEDGSWIKDYSIEMHGVKTEIHKANWRIRFTHDYDVEAYEFFTEPSKER